MKKIIKSFQWALNGLRTVWQQEMNFRIEFIVSMIGILAGVFLRFASLEWIILVVCITAVLAAEVVNTAVENICDRIEPGHDILIGKIKDIMAGFVLLVILGASIVAVILFSSFI
ncbi:MAG: diacylglycerol kinase family protein [Patescibacteria group bacterium]